MSPADVVLVRSVRHFLSLDEKILPHVNFLYFRADLDLIKVLRSDRNLEFYRRLDKCVKLYSINISDLKLAPADLHEMLNILASKQVLEWIVMRNVPIATTSLLLHFNQPSLKVISEHSTAIEIPIDNWSCDYTEHEIIEMLLVGIAANRERPNIAKFSRKRADLRLPFSVLVSTEGVHLSLRLRHMPDDIHRYNHVPARGLRRQTIKLSIRFKPGSDCEMRFDYLKIHSGQNVNPQYFENARQANKFSGWYATHMHRANKNYLAYRPALGINCNDMLFDLASGDLQLSKPQRLTCSIALLIEGISWLYLRQNHLDVKPHNLIYEDYLSVRYIDFDSMHSSNEGEVLHSTRPYCTFEFAPPEAQEGANGYTYGSFTDVYSIARVMQIMLYPVFCEDIPTLYVKTNSRHYPALNAHYNKGISKEFKPELVRLLQAMLHKNYTQRPRLEEVLQTFNELYPQQVAEVIDYQINRWARRVRQQPTAVGLDLLLKLQLRFRQEKLSLRLRQNLITVYEDILEQIDSMDDIHYANELICKIGTLLDHHQDFVLRSVVKLRDQLLLEREYTARHSHITELGVLQNKINYLFCKGLPLVEILLFAKMSLQQFSDGNKKIGILAAELARSLRTLYPQASELHRQILFTNPLLSQPPLAISEIGVYNSSVETMLSLKSIVNDQNDSARLGRLLTVALSNRRLTPCLQLIEAGAKLENSAPPAALEMLSDHLYSSIFNNDHRHLKTFLQASQGSSFLTVKLLQELLDYSVSYDNKMAIDILLQFGASPLSALTECPSMQNKKPGCLSFSSQQQNEALVYSFWPEQVNNLLRRAIQDSDFTYAQKLCAYIKANNSNVVELGRHLVVAARYNQTIVVNTLISLGAVTSVPYPCGAFRGYTLSDFARYYKKSCSLSAFKSG